jgi:adenylate kinase family enzyme
MKRVAVFGNAGAGKSTVARRLSELTSLPLHVIDLMVWKDGKSIPHAQFERAHADLLQQDQWIIDGYGSTELTWQRFERADTLVHVDLPVAVLYARVTKRLIKGLFATPPGWPEGCSVWESSLSSYRVIPRCHRHLTPKYRSVVVASKSAKRVDHLRSAREVQAFLNEVERDAIRNQIHLVTKVKE